MIRVKDKVDLIYSFETNEIQQVMKQNLNVGWKKIAHV